MPEKTSPPKPVRARAAKAAAPRNPDTAPQPAAKAPEGDRLAKVLSRAGIASRREAERLIEAGEVKVNGKLVTSPALNVTARDKITVSGQPVGAPEPARLWLYYKPEGLVTSAADEKGRDTVFDHLPEDMPRVMSVGRLDLNSEGLLLLTNDGELKRRLELPSTGWLRKYRVRVKGNPTDPELDPLRKGITIEGERFQPMDVVLDRHQGANAWLTVGLREGKNREIRRAMSAIGLTVNRLIRVSYGPFRLNELKPGEVEEIRPRVLRDQLGALLPGADGLSEDGAKTGKPRGPAKPSARKPADKASAGRTVKTHAPKARTSVPETATSSGSGRIASPAGRAGLRRLSEAWGEATAPVAGKSVKTAGGARKAPSTGDRPATSSRPSRGPGSGPAKRPPRTRG